MPEPTLLAPEGDGASTPDIRRTTLATLAFVAGGAVPIQLITLSFGWAQYVQGVPRGPELIPTAHRFAEWYVPGLYVPALVILAAITLYCRRRVGLLVESFLRNEDRGWLPEFLLGRAAQRPDGHRSSAG